MIEQLGYLPKPGEEPEVETEQFTLRVLRAKTTRSESVRLTLKKPVELEPLTQEEDE